VRQTPHAIYSYRTFDDYLNWFGHLHVYKQKGSLSDHLLKNAARMTSNQPLQVRDNLIFASHSSILLLEIWPDRPKTRYLPRSLTLLLVFMVKREIACEDERRVEMAGKIAHFPTVSGIDGFDFAEQPSLDPRQIRELAGCSCVALARPCGCGAQSRRGKPSSA